MKIISWSANWTTAISKQFIKNRDMSREMELPASFSLCRFRHTQFSVNLLFMVTLTGYRLIDMPYGLFISDIL